MGRIDDTCRLNVATVKNDIGDGLWAEGGSPLFQLDGQLRGTSVTRIVRFDVSREIGRIYSSNLSEKETVTSER